MEVFKIEWDIGSIYNFEGEDLKPNRTSKKIYKGRFLKNAPAGLKPDVPYCIKVINVAVADCNAPQCREYHELVDFKGEHLRPILARNRAAQICAEQLRKTATCQNSENCVIVEPLLHPLDKLFTNCSKQPIAHRLDAILQFALGCEELTGPENVLGPYYIVAHRDLKKCNILMEYRNGKYHYYIIDFASIRLNKEDPIAPVPDAIPVGTLHGPMSADNTVPEDLAGTYFKVSGNTDVYALGMMLAELFLTIENYTSNNPHVRWATVHGWDPTSAASTNSSLKAAFIEALELYEPNAVWNNTWIEQDLAEHGYKLRWENMADQRILNKIRKLFFDSTHIDPKKRVNLPKFIEQLKKIIDLEKRSTSRVPVSLFLFDQTDFNRNRTSYRQAARDAMAQEKKVRGQSAAVLCVAFRKSLPTDNSWMDAVQGLSNGPLSDAVQLASAIDECSTRNGQGQNTVLYALHLCTQKLLDLIDQPNSPYTFTGQIHLFSPNVPTLQSIAPIELNNGDLIDLMSYTSMMNKAFEGTPIRVFLYSSGAPDIYSGDAKWYTYFQLSAPKDPEGPVYSDHPIPGPVPESSPFTPSKGDTGGSSDFYDGTFDYYILLDDGRKLYIGMK